MMILRGGHSFSLLWFRGGLWKISNETDIEHRGADHFFPKKEKEMKICSWTLL